MSTKSSKKNVERPQPDSLALPPTGADSHAHLDSPELFAKLPELLRRAKAAGVADIGQVFLGPEAFTTCLPTMDACSGPEFPRLFFILGLCPEDGMKLTGAVYEAMRGLFLAESRIRAVGEIGLDFYWEDCPHLTQEHAFRLQLALAKEQDKPVVIHSRNAAPDTLRVLEDEGFAGRPLLWHCFSGDAVEHVERILANGWHVSMPGPVTYRANADLRAVLAHIPADRLLLETDCPYLAPEPWRGKQNEPGFAAFTAMTVAEVLGMDPHALWTLTGNNTRRFFGVSDTCFS